MLLFQEAFTTWNKNRKRQFSYLCRLLCTLWIPAAQRSDAAG